MARLEVRLLGAAHFRHGGEPWRFSAPPRALPLLVLLSLARAPVPRATIAAQLWPDELEADARANVRRHLHHLRRALPPSETPWIDESDGHLVWHADADVAIDLARFEQLVADPQTAAEAVAAYGGDLLEGYDDDEWLTIERERLRSIYLEALLELAIRARRSRDFAAAIAFAERLLAYDDLREDALRELIAARYAASDRSGALAVYERFAARLDGALQVEPMAETIAMAEAIRAHAPLIETDEAPPASSHERWQPAFAGRDTELTTLRRAWSRAASGAGATVFVTGEAGIGKTRVLAELAATVRRQGGRVVTGTTSNPEGEPYEALLVALRRVLAFGIDAADDPRSLAALARVLPELRSLQPAIVAEDGDADDAARNRLFDAIARMVERVARTRPLLLVLEDLHWANAATIDVLATLTRRIGSVPALIAVTFRSDDLAAEHSLRALRTQLVGERRATTLALRRLDASSIGRMLDTAEFVDAPAELGASIHRISDGNPLFAAQLARAYADHGVLPSDGAPREIVDAIASRVERLDQRARAVGEVAAALGTSFAVDVVCEVGGWDEGWVLDGIGELMDVAMVREAGASDYGFTFTHALVAQAFADATPAASRAPRHRRIARVLERRTRDARALETIARHWRLAGDGRHASDAYVHAATAALAVFARSEAVAFARLAADLATDDRRRFTALRIAAAARARSADLDGWDDDLVQLEGVAARLSDRDRFEALALREMQLWQIGDRDHGHRVVDEMAALAGAIGEPSLQARAWDAQGALELERDLHGAARLFRAALGAAERCADTPLVAQTRQHLIQALLRTGAGDEATALLEVQRELFGSVPTDAQQIDLLRAQASLAITHEDGERATEAGTAMLALSERGGDADGQAKAHSLLAYGAHLSYDPARARKHYDAAIEIAERSGRRQLVVTLLVNRGHIEADIGRHDVAVEIWNRALPLTEETQLQVARGSLLIGRGELALMRGDLDTGEQCARVALACGDETGEQISRAGGLVLLGAVQCARGEIAAGLESLRRGAAERATIDARLMLADDRAVLLEALVAAGEQGEAEALAQVLAESFADGPERHRHPGRIAFALAREAAGRGDRASCDALIRHGRALIAERVMRLGADGAAYAALPFNRAPEELAGTPR